MHSGHSSVLVIGKNCPLHNIKDLCYIPTVSKGTDDQLKLAHKVVDVVDQSHKKNSLTLLGYRVDNQKEFFCSCPIFCEEESGREFPTKCNCEVQT